MFRKPILAVLFLIPQAVLAQEKPTLVLDSGGHTNSVTKLFFLPGNKEILSVSKDKTIRIWDVASGEAVRVLRNPVGPGRSGTHYAAALSPDGKTLAVAPILLQENDENWIYLISLPTGQIERVLKGHKGMIYTSGLAFSPDGKWLASASDENSEVRIWNLAEGTHRWFTQKFTNPDFRFGPRLAFSPDSRYFVACYGSFARVRLTEKGEEVAILQKEDWKGHFTSAAWSPDGKTIATGSSRSVFLWNPDGSLKKEINNFGPGQVLSTTFSLDSKELLITRGYGNPECSILNLEDGAERVRFQGPGEFQTWDGALSSDGKLAATGNLLGENFFLWRTDNGQIVRRLSGQGRTLWAAGWGPAGTIIAWGTQGTREGLNARHPLERSFNLAELEWGPPPDGRFTQIVDRRGNLAIEAGSNTSLTVKIEGSESAPPLKLHPLQHPPRAWGLMGDQRLVVGGNKRLSLYDVANREELYGEYLGHDGEIYAVAPSPNGKLFLTASGDQTLSLWNPDRALPLLTCFFAGQEWIIWTPEGYYASSPGGERLMGWQLNQGLEKMAYFYPAAQFRKSLYRPDVIRRIVHTGNVPLALEQADKERGKSTGPISVDKVLPPLVLITSPTQVKSVVHEPKIEIHVLAKSLAHPITGLKLLVNGRPYSGPQGVRIYSPGKQGEVRETLQIDLVEGSNQIAVQAESLVSKALSEAVEIVYDKNRGGKTSPETKKDEWELPNLFVLAVGISDYPGELKLNYATRDAKVLAETLQATSHSLYKKVEVKVLTDKDASLRNIRQGLGWLKKQMTQRDVGIFFFAGHGDKDNTGIFYLLPADVDPDDIPSTGVPAGLIREVMQNIPGRVIMMLDACHSGSVEGKRSGRITEDLQRDLISDECGVTIMCSSTGREFSLESNAEKHGMFTKGAGGGIGRQGRLQQGWCDLFQRAGFIHQ